MELKKKIKGVIFDLDGTLVQFKIDYVKAKGEVYNYFRSLDIPEHLFSGKPIFTGLINIINFLKNKHVSNKDIQKIKEKVNSIVCKYELDAAKKTVLIPYAREILKYIKSKGLKLGLFTVNHRKVVEYILSKMKIKDFFDAIVTRDDVKEPKPSSEHLLAVLNRLHLKPYEVIVVGDHPIDFEAASKMGAITVGFESRLKLSYLKSKGTLTYVIQNIKELRDIIERVEKIY